MRNKLEIKNLEAMLRISLEGPYENFDNIIKETIFYEKMKLHTGSYMLTIQVICLLQVTFLVQQLRLCSPIIRMSISSKVACIIILSNL